MTDTTVRERPIDTILVDAFKSGKAAAEAVPSDGDGGSCNRDCVMVRIPRLHAVRVGAAAKRAGVRVASLTWGRRRWWMVSGWPDGQASDRTKRAEAAATAMEKVLDGTDVSVMVFYAAD